MAFWYNDGSQRFHTLSNPGLWTATKQSFAAFLNESVQFLRTVKADYLRGISDAQVQQENDGGYMLHVVGTTPNGSTGYYRTLADRDLYSGTLASGNFRHRYITVMGSFIFLETPVNAIPGGIAESLLICNLLKGEGNDVKPMLGTWYTSGGSSRPIDGSSTRVFQRTGTYDDGDHDYELCLYAGADESEDDGKLILYENAPHGVAFNFLFFISPRCEQG
ncbi:hypothetical protein KDL45_03345 [bacterium]|nr:hypothetical protein [bacterium]